MNLLASSVRRLLREPARHAVLACLIALMVLGSGCRRAPQLAPDAQRALATARREARLRLSWYRDAEYEVSAVEGGRYTVLITRKGHTDVIGEDALVTVDAHGRVEGFMHGL